MTWFSSQACQNGIALLSLIVAAIGLRFLVSYVRATRVIAKQSIEQSEATSRPAVVVKGGSSIEAAPILVNIGNGPAIELKWSIPGHSKNGVVPYLQQGQSYSLGEDVMARLRAVATYARMGDDPVEEELKARIVCEYRSLSGTKYSSSNGYDFNSGDFITTFGDAS
jgi:hypothetical protein